MRAVAFAGLASASASLAHGDTRDPGWIGVALLGAAAATMVLLAAGSLAGRRLAGHAALPLGVLVCAMLLAQAAAHVALLVAGAPAHAGAGGTLALHVVLALLAALVVRGIDVRIEAAQLRRGPAPTMAAAPLRERLFAIEPVTVFAARCARGRAPPKPA
jgi:hypothetical protein